MIVTQRAFHPAPSVIARPSERCGQIAIGERRSNDARNASRRR